MEEINQFWAEFMTNKVKELQAALATAREELVRHEASDKEWEKECDAFYLSVFKRGVASGRATALEEAAQWIEVHSYSSAIHPDNYAEAIRALAPLPASVVVLPVETIEKVRDALTKHHNRHSDYSDRGNALDLESHTALALLDKVKP